MADDGKPVRKKKTLPPLSPKGDGDNSEAKPERKKVKKKVPRNEDGGAPSAEKMDEEKPTPRRRRKRSPSQSKERARSETPADPTRDDTASPSTAAPKKKKKKPKAAAPVEGITDDTGAGGETTPKETQGSKTSLITKEGETPRKKAGAKKKKKVKKAAAAASQEDEYGETPWAEDLRTMEEDIITAGDKEAEEEEEGEEGADPKEKTVYKKDLKTTSVLVPSRPLDKIFVETSTKFKGLNRGILTKQMAEDTYKAGTGDAPTPVITRQTTIDFALASHKLFRVVTLFLHGLTAGMCLWQLVMIFKLTGFNKQDFLEHYYEISLPFHCSLYFLLALCAVSVCDRFDVGNPTPRFILRSLTLQNGTVSLVLYLVAIVINVVALKYEDKIYLYKEQDSDSSSTLPGTTANPADWIKEDDVDMFKNLNTARCVFAVLSWCVLAITPNSDRLGKNLTSGETGLANELKLDKVSLA